MPRRFIAMLAVESVLLGAAGGGLVGCTISGRLNLPARTAGNAALFGQFRAYDGRTGRAVSLAEVIRRARRADVVFFGEQHEDVVCNALEAQVLAGLADSVRPVALSMEFFERDTQTALNNYLHGTLDEAAFGRQTRQGRAYVLAHRPLIEMARAGGVPVIAANAPRRLVRAYRKSDLAYDAWFASLPAPERIWLPLASAHLGGAYESRFLAMMSGHGDAGVPTPTPGPPAGPPPNGMPAGMPSAPPTGEATAPTSMPATRPPMPPASSMPAMPPMPRGQPAPAGAPATQPATATAETQPTASQPATPTTAPAEDAVDPARFYAAQLLWDDAMAEAIAEFREHVPGTRIMHIVGVFHVAADGGTVQKLRHRRPHDRIFTIAYSSTSDGRVQFDPEDRGAGDIVIYGIAPLPEEKPAGMPAMPGAPRGGPPAGATTAPAATSAPSATTAPLPAMAPSHPAGVPGGPPAMPPGTVRSQ